MINYGTGVPASEPRGERRAGVGVGWKLPAIVVATCAVLVLVGYSSLPQPQPVEMADLIDPDGVNPQRVLDVFNDLEAEAKMGRSTARNVLHKAKKLLDKHLSIVVDTQTLKKGGRPGPVGPMGKKGKPGYQGPVGAEGDRGPQGDIGPVGNKGFPGPQGFRGDTGDTGPEGERGPPGIVGQAGFPGPPGPRGPLGTPGKRGVRGPPGQDGYAGLPGSQGLPGMKGVRGPRGVYKVVDAHKKCKEIGGKMYKGVCLKSSSLNTNADDIPLGCHTYIPYMLWSFTDVHRIENMFKTVSNVGTHSCGGGCQRGGLCSNYHAIMSFTQASYNNHRWIHSGTFNWGPPHHHCWWWFGTHCRYYCQIGPGAIGVYACRMW